MGEAREEGGVREALEQLDEQHGGALEVVGLDGLVLGEEQDVLGLAAVRLVEQRVARGGEQDEEEEGPERGREVELVLEGEAEGQGHLVEAVKAEGQEVRLDDTEQQTPPVPSFPEPSVDGLEDPHRRTMRLTKKLQTQSDKGIEENINH